jgi:hypothetical protein
MFFQIIIISFILLILALILYYVKKEKLFEKFETKTVIPLHIYQTWTTKNLPPKMRKCVNKIKNDNPEFTHHLYDDNDCRKFIEKNFNADVLNAYDKLNPGAYKADLWRYCVMYKKGGIYIDIKFQCEPGFKLMEITDREHFVFERPYADFQCPIKDELKIINNPDYYKNVYNKIDTFYWQNKQIGIYNAVLACKPGNKYMLECINNCVKNVKNNYYGYNPLYPTGPGLLGNLYFNGDYSKIKDFELFNSLVGNCILNRNRVIMRHYPEYRAEQQKYSAKEPSYHKLWVEKKIYNLY